MKKCTKCNETKKLEYFNKKSPESEKYRARCKKCSYEDEIERKERKKKGLPSLSEINKNKPPLKEKICTKCHIKQPIENYHYLGGGRKGRKASCRTCCNTYMEELREDKIFQANQKIYRQKPHVKKMRNIATKKFRKGNEKERLISILRVESQTIINSIKKGKPKHKRCQKLFGCTINNLKKWFEYQFDIYMNWTNYGEYWNIDHIKACSLFNILDENERKICSNWKNVRPIETNKNERKSNKYNIKIKLLHEIVLYSFSKNINF